MSSEPTAGQGDEKKSGDHERPTSTEWPAYPGEGADAFLAVTQGRYEHQMATLDALDNKAGALFAGGVAEAGFLLAMLALRPADHPLSPISWAAIVLVAGATTWVLAWAWAAQHIREWAGYPDHTELWNSGYDPMPLAWHAAMTLDASHKANEKGRAEKTKQVKKAGVGIVVLTMLVVAASIAIVAT